MAEASLRDRRILVVEDEYMLASELQGDFEDAAAVVLGPVATVAAAIALIIAEPRIDGAVIDVNLGGEMAFPVGDLLIERGVPFIFVTGYDPTALPERFARIARCEKPLNFARVSAALCAAGS